MAKAIGKKSEDIVRSSDILRAIADLDRLRLILQLRDGKKNVGTLAELIDVEIVNVSHHLSVLRKSEIVRTEKVGRFVYYSLNSDVVIQDGDGSLQFQMPGHRLTLS